MRWSRADVRIFVRIVRVDEPGARGVPQAAARCGVFARVQIYGADLLVLTQDTAVPRQGRAVYSGAGWGECGYALSPLFPCAAVG